MSSSLESQVLFAIWELYQQNKISLEQKGCIKDLLIRKDENFYSFIGNCQKFDELEERLLDILNCIEFLFFSDQGSPRDLDAEEAICPIIRLSNPSNTPTTIKSFQNQPQKRFRFMSSSNESEIAQNNQKQRSNSFHHQ
ncbi:unnamed protein product (macronuclear) [Paramecium tetraurelia]|uniref:Uncharacterized protein n=1 Tax=Paramecium tetraurelia TaxID=5888 RepID=A0DAL4_PARTE|nr:uncharacterized protein GSPATT00014988001 [Paramecium tetraurelia]CAK80081.1 unnamed protein product [Paramecium tetraurelia]|eukprot:XP_001447478.1 hypothetical protein (macronuclear) [Paramecium tetraurelia strain d4-2]